MRPPGVVDQRYTSLYLFAASRPGTDEAFALALPRADAGTMGVFLDHFSRQLAPDVQAVLLLDQAGWHDQRALRVPGTVTLLPLPSASPALNPVERIWLYLRERYLSLAGAHGVVLRGVWWIMLSGGSVGGADRVWRGRTWLASGA